MRLGALAILAVVAGSAAAFADDGYKWIFDTDNDGASLTYMVPDSDAIDVILSCSHKQQMGHYSEIETDDKLNDKTKATVKFSVNGKSFSYKGKLSPNEEAGSPTFDADIPLKDAFWAELAKAEDFKVDISGVKDNHTLKGADIAKLLKSCQK